LFGQFDQFFEPAYAANEFDNYNDKKLQNLLKCLLDEITVQLHKRLLIHTLPRRVINFSAVG